MCFTAELTGLLCYVFLLRIIIALNIIFVYRYESSSDSSSDNELTINENPRMQADIKDRLKTKPILLEVMYHFDHFLNILVRCILLSRAKLFIC